MPSHATSIAPIRAHAQTIFHTKRTGGNKVKLSKKEARDIAAALHEIEQSSIRSGVNASRIQPKDIFRQYKAGVRVEFETLGPYLGDYITNNGTMTTDNLLPEDEIGLQLAVLLRQLFPESRLISLCDDYNSSKLYGPHTSPAQGDFSASQKQKLHTSLTALYRSQGALLPHHKSPRDFLLISEASKVDDARVLVAALDKKGYIQRDGLAITFVNEDAENPLHTHIRLRTKTGRWLCEALDAASFWKAENFTIVHIVILPGYMRDQQDKVWEILRVLGIHPSRYHNIFFDPASSPEDIVAAVSQVFGK